MAAPLLQRLFIVAAKLWRTMFKPRVIIVGAGAAGLAAAARLSAAGIRTLVLEGRDRIGGRAWTVLDPKAAAPIELGAEFIHGRPEATWKHVRQAGLLAYDVPFEHRRMLGGRLLKVEDYAKAMAPVMSGLARVRRDMPFAEYLRRHRGGRAFAEARRLAIDFVQGFDAADPERISAKSLAAEQEGLGDVEGQTQFRLLAGYGALIAHLRGLSSREIVRYRMSTVVTEIRWEKGAVELICRHARRADSRPFTLRTRAVIVTLPLGVLQLPPGTPGGVRFVPEIAAKRRALSKLASGPIVKAVVRFRSAFWEDRAVPLATGAGKGLSEAVFLHDPGAAFPTWWTSRPLRVPVLTGWAGGPKAALLAGRSRSALGDASVESLAGIFRKRSAAIRRLIERIDVCDWESDPLARGAYSYELVGGASARRALARPEGRTVFFAGEATDTTGQASTVAGAIASGERAAAEVIGAV